MRIIELFGGIGACTKAIKNLGIDLEVLDYVEIDKYAVNSYNAINGTNFEPQDITEWNKHFEDVDLIMHGSPCQNFSLAGDRTGGDENSGTKSSLMYETLRIVKNIRPKVVIWEKVKNLIGVKNVHNFNNYIKRMEELGYVSNYQVLNAKDFDLPQNRERVFTVSIREDVGINYTFPNKRELKINLKDLLEDIVDDKYFISDKMIKYIANDNEKWTGNNGKALINKTIASTINTGEGTRRCDASNYVSDKLPNNYDLKIDVVGKTISGGERSLILNADGLCNCLTATDYKQPKQIAIQDLNELKIRKLTPKECWRLMGFDDDDFEKAQKVNSNTQLYKQAGNNIAVNVLQSILGGFNGKL